MMLDFYKGKRVLITGHTGFKGSWLSKILIMAGADVYGYSLAPEEGKENLYEISGIADEMDSHIGDIREGVATDNCVGAFRLLWRRAFR